MADKKYKLNYQTEPKKNGCYTAKEISQMLGVGIETARNLIRSNQFESVRFPKEYRVVKSSFDAWLEKKYKEELQNGNDSKKKK